jgi:hypothetical protein
MIGRPPSSWTSFERAERKRVLRPAASTTAPIDPAPGGRFGV